MPRFALVSGFLLYAFDGQQNSQGVNKYDNSLWVVSTIQVTQDQDSFFESIYVCINFPFT